MGGVEKGLTILRSMKKMGLLLTPEIPQWPDILSGDSVSEPWSIAQIRCCFTLLEPSELLQHAKVFGPFAIEFDTKVLREFGAIPVFYLPSISKPGDASGELSAALVACIGEIDVLLDRLSQLEGLTRSNPNKDERVVITKNGRVVRKIACSVGGAEDLLLSLTEGNQPLTNLRAALQALGGFFYPAEDLKYTDLLEYYHEREWRILSGAAKETVRVARRLDKHEEECLLRLDGDFYSEQMLFRTGPGRRVDECRVFEQLNGKLIVRYARRVIAPEVAVPRANEILNEPDDPPVVALESLGGKPCSGPGHGCNV